MITSAILVLLFWTIRLGTSQKKVNKWESNRQTDTILAKGEISKMFLEVSGKERKTKSFQKTQKSLQPTCQNAIPMAILNALTEK